MARETANSAAGVVARELSRVPPKARAKFLRELLAHAASGIVVIEGEAEAAEAIYRLADAVVARAARAA